jgi:hypothetical protein
VDIVPAGLPEPVSEVLRHLLQPDPALRWTCAQLASCRWLQSASELHPLRPPALVQPDTPSLHSDATDAAQTSDKRPNGEAEEAADANRGTRDAPDHGAVATSAQDLDAPDHPERASKRGRWSGAAAAAPPPSVDGTGALLPSVVPPPVGVQHVRHLGWEGITCASSLALDHAVCNVPRR